jgi:hypothetical protein
MKLDSSQQILEKSSNIIPSVIKIGPLGAELFDADRQTDMTKLIVAFHSFPNAPKNQQMRTSM